MILPRRDPLPNNQNRSDEAAGGVARSGSAQGRRGALSSALLLSAIGLAIGAACVVQVASEVARAVVRPVAVVVVLVAMFRLGALVGGEL